MHSQTGCLADSGYLGLSKSHPNSRLPHKRSKLHPLTKEQRADNRQLSRERFVVEHIIRSVKIFRILAERYRKSAQAVRPALQPDRRHLQLRAANLRLTQEVYYLITSVGWQGYRRVAHNLLHLDIIGGKIWVQKDGTEDGIAAELEAAGVPKHDIVLAFRHIQDRAIIPDYAVT